MIALPCHASPHIIEELRQDQKSVRKIIQSVSGQSQSQIKQSPTYKTLELEQLEPLVITPPNNQALRLVKHGTPQTERIFSNSLLDIYFDTQYQFLRGGASAALEDVFHLFIRQQNWELQIQSYCDDRGNSAYNVALGARHNQNVRDFFVNLGFLPERIHTTSFGDKKQWCGERSAKCQAENLRLQYGFQVLAPNHTRLGCFMRIRIQTRNGENELNLNHPSLSVLQPLHLAQSM